ncbi:hypothetical protein AHAS_Ahas15G0249500 [Arachis hypogaea]
MQEALEAHNGPAKKNTLLGLDRIAWHSTMSNNQKSGNIDIEGIDSTNACYGGTTAIFNCVNWVDSSSWDGRYGLVICADNVVVDGKFSQNCFLMALDSFYKVFCEKFEKLEGKPFSMAEANYFVFHSPYNKLVQKSFGRLFYNDFLRVENGDNQIGNLILYLIKLVLFFYESFNLNVNFMTNFVRMT